MTKEEIFEKCTKAGILQVATVEGDQPHVRTVMLYRADENGIIFHTAVMKEFFQQIQNNPKAELCFNCESMMIRVKGELEIVEDRQLLEEIVESPSRAFMRAWRDNGVFDDFYNSVKVLRMKNGVATTWTMETNFAPKEYIQL